MLFGIGLLPLMSYGGVDVFGDSPVLEVAVAIVGVLMMATGGYLQSLSSRPAS